MLQTLTVRKYVRRTAHTHTEGPFYAHFSQIRIRSTKKQPQKKTKKMNYKQSLCDDLLTYVT